jgi:hypothetical protein
VSRTDHSAGGNDRILPDGQRQGRCSFLNLHGAARGFSWTGQQSGPGSPRGCGIRPQIVAVNVNPARFIGVKVRVVDAEDVSSANHVHVAGQRVVETALQFVDAMDSWSRLISDRERRGWWPNMRPFCMTFPLRRCTWSPRTPNVTVGLGYRPGHGFWSTSLSQQALAVVGIRKQPVVGIRKQQRVTGPMVEMGGIEPPSTAVVMCLLRVYPVKSFYSAPEFATGI